MTSIEREKLIEKTIKKIFKNDKPLTKIYFDMVKKSILKKVEFELEMIEKYGDLV